MGVGAWIWVGLGSVCSFVDDRVFVFCRFFFFKQKTAYEMRISYWSSDVCSSDLPPHPGPVAAAEAFGANIGLTLLVGVPVAVASWYIGVQIGRASCRASVCQSL